MAPSVRPVVVSAIGSAQRVGGNQFLMTSAMTGKTGAWNTPISARTSNRAIRPATAPGNKRPGSRAVSAAHRPQSTMTHVMIRRDPIFSPQMPPGSWKIV